MTARIIRPCNSCHLNSVINTFSVAAVWESCQRMYKKNPKPMRWKSKRFLFFFFYWQIKVKARRQEAGRLLSSHLDKSFCLSSRPMVPTKPTQKARGHCHFQCWVLFLSFLPAEPVESGSLLLGYFTSPLHSRPVCVRARTLLSAVIKNLTPTKARCFESAAKIVALQSLALFKDSAQRSQGFFSVPSFASKGFFSSWASKCMLLQCIKRSKTTAAFHANTPKGWWARLCCSGIRCVYISKASYNMWRWDGVG